MLVLVPSGRDVEAGNSQVLERIGIGQPGNDCSGWLSPYWKGLDNITKQVGNHQVLERIDID